MFQTNFEVTPESLSDNPLNSYLCHSERSEESHALNYLHHRDSSADASE